MERGNGNIEHTDAHYCAGFPAPYTVANSGEVGGSGNDRYYNGGGRYRAIHGSFTRLG